MAGWGIDMSGDDRLKKLLQTAITGAPTLLGAALYEEMSLAFRQSQKEVPVRKGYLKNSARLSQPETSGSGTITVSITYGSAAAPYAGPVHDINKNYNGGRKWHYVADPVRARIQNLDQRLLKRVARALGGL